MNKNIRAPSNSQIVIYRTESGEVKLDVRFDGDTVWLTQKMMAELFDVNIPTINEHLRNIYGEAELAEDSTIRKFRIVQAEGGIYRVNDRNILRDARKMSYDLASISEIPLSA